MVPDSTALVMALLFARHDETGQDRDHRAVHRHRHADLVQRDAVEQDLHVLDAVDRHTGLADIAHHARMIAVIAAVRGQIEGDRHALLTGRQIAAVEGVGFLGGRKPGILPDGPGPARIHRGLHAAGERRRPGDRAQMRQIPPDRLRYRAAEPRSLPAFSRSDRQRCGRAVPFQRAHAMRLSSMSCGLSSCRLRRAAGFIPVLSGLVSSIRVASPSAPARSQNRSSA